MAALDRLLQLQQQGFAEQEIINVLQQEGFQMKEINDSLNQAKIKSAVSQGSEQYESSVQENSIGDYTSGGNYLPVDNAQGSYPIQGEQPYTDYPAQQEYGAGYYQDQGGSTETMTDIAQQVINEKTQEINKKIDVLTQAKNQNQRDVEELKDRIKRIEASLDVIQKAIIGKIGEFGESTKMVQKDLENIHGTMSKMMNPLMDNYNELQKFNAKHSKE